MSSQIRRKIAHRVLDLCKLDVSPSVEEIAKKLRLIERIECKREPIAFQLPVTSYGETRNTALAFQPKEELAHSFKGDDTITSVQYDYSGSNLLFVLHPPNFAQQVLDNTLKNKDDGQSNVLLKNVPRQKIVVEFSSPNIAKPFHVGHLRSTVIGNFITNIYKAAGHEVTSLNYLGDWGTQFGLLSLGFEMMGSGLELRKDPIGHLFKIYVAINEMATKDPNIALKAKENFSNLEQGAEKAVKTWKRFRDYSIQDLTETYQRLGITFSDFHGESMYSQNVITDLLHTLRSSGLLQTIDGAECIEMNTSKTKQILHLMKRDGSTLYLTRDIAAAADRYQRYNFDHMYYVVANGQNDHFTALFDVLKRMEKPWYKRLHHVKFGNIHNMSTRKGTAVFLRDILDEAKIRMLEWMEKSPNTRVTENQEEVADALGVSAVFINDMKYKRNKDYKFDWDRLLSNEGNLGPQLQYSHARLCSLQKNCGITLDTYEARHLVEPEAVNLLRALSRFEEVLEDAYESLEPCYLVKYLFKLRSAINSAHKRLKVKDANAELAQARLALFTASQIAMNRGLKIVGVTPLERI